MANVFGDPITDSTLEGIAEYANRLEYRGPTAFERAHIAINRKNANMKDANAHTYVENLKKQRGTALSTLCLVYNATGDTMTLVGSKDRSGRIGQAPYPILIQNGQWGAFLHARVSEVTPGSIAGVVYRGKNGNKGDDCDYMMAWSNTEYDNSVWTEAREVNHFTDATWNYLFGKLKKTGCIYRDSWEGCLSIISTGSDTSPVVEATFTLEDAVNY